MKKVLALTLALVLALGMSTVAFAAATKVAKDFNYVGAATTRSGGAADSDELIDLSLSYFRAEKSEPGDWLSAAPEYNADGTMANWEDINGATVGTTAPRTRGPYAGNFNVSKRFIARNNIEVKIKWVKGSVVFDGASINDAGQIKLSYKDAITSIKDIDYEYQVLLSVNGKTIADRDANITVEGTYEPDKNDGLWTDNYFEFNGRNYVTPDTYVRNMEFALNEDEDVTVWGRALKGVKYYGWVSNDFNPSDEDLCVQHPEIVGVYHIEEINLKNVTEKVTFNNEDGSLYVYNKDLQLLGQVKDDITTLEPTYYLASAQLDVDDIEPDDGDDGDDDGYEPDDWGGNSGTGGDDLYPENPHDNPGTGK